MAILTRGTVLTLSASIQIVDMFAFKENIYYLAKFVSREGVVAKDLTDIPLLLLSTDPDVVIIPEDAMVYAKEYLARKYGDGA